MILARKAVLRFGVYQVVTCCRDKALSVFVECISTATRMVAFLRSPIKRDKLNYHERASTSVFELMTTTLSADRVASSAQPLHEDAAK